MMRTQAVIRFHLDENVHHAVAHALKLRGVDVTTTTDVNLVAASDKDQLAFAISSERVLFTHDADFLRPDLTGRKHHGIVYSPKNARGIGGNRSLSRAADAKHGSRRTSRSGGVFLGKE